MKRSFTWMMIAMAFGLTACGSRAGSPTTAAAETDSETTQALSDESNREGVVELTLWTFPVGDWGNRTTVSSLLSSFRKDHPDIHISVGYVDYYTGDAKIEEAIQDGCAPDLVLESPERIVAGWAERGLMADLSDLWEEKGQGIYEQVQNASRDEEGRYPFFPLCMTAQCMAIDRDLFREAGALRYIDEETRTWTTEDFIKAVEALKDYGQDPVAVVYCGGQGGDQGTRGLVTGLYGGTFANMEHTGYTVDSEENIRALQLLYDLDGIVFDPDKVGGDEQEMFCRGELAMTFCWNGSFEVAQAVQNPDRAFDIVPMAFPTPTGKPDLQGGLWGFGVFDNGDEAKIRAAKEFIRYMTDEEGQYTRAVQISHFWPVREMADIYANDALMQEYSLFIPYVGDYYQVTLHWAQARTAWWQMLQKVGEGGDIAAAAKGFAEDVEKAGDGT